jgi:hypothetical protein
MSNRFVRIFHVSSIVPSFLGAYSNKFSLFAIPFQGQLKSIIPHQFIFDKGEVFRVPSACKELYVLSGRAWVTHDGKDIILNSGERASLISNKDCTLVSALGKVPLSLEVM